MTPLDHPEEKTPGSRLREIRQSYGLTIKQLAERMGDGVHFTTISKLERGTMTLTYDWAKKIASTLPISPMELISENYKRTGYNSVPLYSYYSWTPEKGVVGAEQLGWIPSMSGGQSSFALGFFPHDEIRDQETPLNSVIDPERRALQEGVLYAIYPDDNFRTMIATFRLDPPRLSVDGTRHEFILGEKSVVVIGQVVFQCRSFWWS
jgi:transcriptional regulator with XRE-family HTH domain